MSFITQFLHFLLNLSEAQFLSIVLHGGPFRRQIDSGVINSRHGIQAFFNPRGTRGAAHAGNFEFRPVCNDLITEVGYFGSEFLQADLRRVIGNPGFFGGEIYRGFFYAGHFGQAFFNPGCAGGAGHPGNF